ncbi:hypothetical protein HDU96_009251 [Phlyctochytrium bullatum]|nr:hypothetical protein HDU96_009251 [Phlyctochytrium bullatum]
MVELMSEQPPMAVSRRRGHPLTGRTSIIPDDILHHLLPYLTRHDLSSARLVSRQWDHVAAPRLMSRLAFPLYKHAEPKAVSPFHHTTLQPPFTDADRDLLQAFESRRRSARNSHRLTAFFDDGILDGLGARYGSSASLKAFGSLLFVRELDLTGVLFLPAHATDRLFDTSSPSALRPNEPLGPAVVKQLIRRIDAEGPSNAPQSPRPVPLASYSMDAPQACRMIDLVAQVPLLATLKLRSVDLAIVLALLSPPAAAVDATHLPYLRSLELWECHAPPHGSPAAQWLQQLADDTTTPAGASRRRVLAGLASLSTSTCGAACTKCLMPGSVLCDAVGPGLSSRLGSLTFGDFGWACVDEEEEAWKLAQRCGGVRELMMVGQSQPFVSFQAVSVLFSTWRNLTAVAFSYYSDVNDAIVLALSASCPHLRDLSLLVVTYDSITSASLHALARRPTPLRSLLLHAGTRPTDAALLTLLLSHPHLERLQLPGCTTERTLMVCLARCRKLRHLSIGGGAKPFTAAALSWIGREGAGLRALRVRSRTLPVEAVGEGLAGPAARIGKGPGEGRCWMDLGFGYQRGSPVEKLVPNAKLGRLEWKGFELVPVEE